MATITKLKWVNKSGDHEAWVLAFTDANGTRHKEQFERKRDADGKRIEVEAQVRGGAFRADAKDRTVDEVCKAYVEHLEGRRIRQEHVTEHYLRTSRAQLFNYVTPQPGRAITFEHGLGPTKLVHLTARSVAEFRDRLRDNGVGVVTTRRVLGSLSRALDHAVANDWIAANVAAKTKVIGRRDEGSQKVVAPSKQALALVLAAADDDFKIRLMFAAASGLRASEQHALRWRRVDLVKGRVTVDSRVDAYGNVDTTKSRAGIREVLLNKQVVAGLQRWKARSRFNAPDDLVFPNGRGTHVDHRLMSQRLFRPLLAAVAAAAKKKGTEFEEFGWHALRHFAVSTWIEAGLAPKTVQTYAGHSSMAVTTDRYGHLFPRDEHRDAMDKIGDEIFADAPAPDGA